MVGTPSAPRSPAVQAGPDGDVSFNFVNADVREVIREILGNQLHLNYVIDGKVQGTITAQTGGPIKREAVLPTFESVLRANGLALSQANDLYRVLPIEDALKSGIAAGGGPNQPGYGVRVLPLRYVSAAELKNILEPFVPPGGTLQVDSARNLLILAGSGSDVGGLADLVRQFDVDWLAGTSFALYPLRVGMAKDIAQELETIFGESGTGPMAGLVRIVPIERLNAILVISPQRGYLSQVKGWIDRLDYGDDQTTPRVFQYHVQNSRAADLAAVLTQLLSAGSVSTVEPTAAPGSKLVELGTQQASGTLGLTGGASGGAGGMPGAGSPGMATPGAGAFTAAGNSPGGAGGMPGTGALGLGTGGQGQRGAAAPAGDLQRGLQPGIAGGGANPELKTPPVRIVADEKNNALLVFARPRDYRMIEEAIRRLDVVPLQVLIEATIAEVTLNDNLQYGLQWFFQQASSKFELTNAASGIINGSDIAGVFPGFNFLVGGGKEKLVLNALSSLTHVDVVSSPELLVLDHQTAALQVGDQVPVITQTAQSVVTTGAPVVNSVQYLNTGVVLQVTPRVNSSGLITLDIDQSVSDVATTTSSTINSPTITQRRIVTSAVVQDGETIALGGLIIDNRNRSRTGLPLLSEIPVIGALFSTTRHTNSRTELLVLLTPRILRNAQEAHDMTEDLRQRMRTIKPLELRTQ